MVAKSSIQNKLDVSFFLQSHGAGQKQRPAQGCGFHNGSRPGLGDYRVGGNHQLFHIIDESVHPGMLGQWVAFVEFPKQGLIPSHDRQNGDLWALTFKFRNQGFQGTAASSAACQKNGEPVNGQAELPADSGTVRLRLAESRVDGKANQTELLGWNTVAFGDFKGFRRGQQVKISAGGYPGSMHTDQIGNHRDYGPARLRFIPIGTHRADGERVNDDHQVGVEFFDYFANAAAGKPIQQVGGKIHKEGRV